MLFLRPQGCLFGKACLSNTRVCRGQDDVKMKQTSLPQQPRAGREDTSSNMAGTHPEMAVIPRRHR